MKEIRRLEWTNEEKETGGRGRNVVSGTALSWSAQKDTALINKGRADKEKPTQNNRKQRKKIKKKKKLANNAGQQNLTFFFVPRTSIDELSSTSYAEFRYVYKIFLSGRISKIQMNLNVQNSTLRAHETGRNFPLTCRGVWHLPLFGVRSSNGLPTYLRATCLGTAFHSHYILVKSFTMFFTDFAEIFWEKIQV